MSPSRCLSAQRATAYLTLVGFGLVLAAYVVTLTGLIDHGMWRDSAARFGFIAALVLVAWTAHLSLRPTGGLLEPLIAKFGGSVIHRIRFVIYLAGIGFPLAMVVLSALGYGFTANVLIIRAIITLASLLIAATLWAGVKILSARGWQMLTGSTPPRQFDEYGEIQTEVVTDAQVTGVLGEHFLELKHQLAFLCQCALVVGAIVCFGWLWIDVFPNVRMGNPVVWTVQDTVTQSSVDAAGQTTTSSVVETTPVTALHLLLAAATLFVAFQLAKLLPALFDALVLQRVSFDEGMEHFSLVLGRCLLFGVGCFVACKWVGVRWQTIQWLAVGLTIGLGFGLQDMVRNLFGGLVVLFEKPARLGDLITVGQVTGRVAAQKFRTTVLSDDEGREVIIPNKNFVSEEVVNWMGAGRLNVIPIEVAVKSRRTPRRHLSNPARAGHRATRRPIDPRPASHLGLRRKSLSTHRSSRLDRGGTRRIPLSRFVAEGRQHVLERERTAGRNPAVAATDARCHGRRIRRGVSIPCESRPQAFRVKSKVENKWPAIPACDR